MITLRVEQVGHSYGMRRVFENVSFSVEHGAVLACTGRNGSGKSTLLRIIAGLLTPRSGLVTLTCNGSTSSDPEWRRRNSGYSAPGFAIYDELTVEELIAFHSDCRGIDRASVASLLEESGFAKHAAVRVGALSSGMVQRLKLILAFAGEPAMVILDEPSTNLDQHGIEMLQRWVARAQQHAIIVIATNMMTELPWCTHYFDIEARMFSHAESNVRARADHE